MRASHIYAIAAFGLCMAGCAARQARHASEVSATPKVREFEKIEVDAYCEVEYTQGEKCQVRIEGDREAVDNIAVSVSNGTLTIQQSLKKRILGLKRGNGMKVYVTSPDLIAVSLFKSGEFKACGKIDSDILELSLYGAGDIDCSDIICDELRLSLRGAGDIKLPNAVCQRSSISLYGAGDIEATLANATFANIELKGTGEIDVTFDRCRKAACTVYGVGGISLKGTLQQLEKSVKGIGSVDTKQLKVGG